MKINTTSVKKNFEPVDITFTVESAHDLAVLFTLFNVANPQIRDKTNDMSPHLDKSKVDTYPIWNIVHKICVDKKLLED